MQAAKSTPGEKKNPNAILINTSSGGVELMVGGRTIQSFYPISIFFSLLFFLGI